MSHSISVSAGNSQLTFETGKLAKLADGAVTVRCGDTIVIVTAVSATTIKEGQDFFPLTVEYKEKAAAVGKFPGGYFKREGRPSEKEILTARMTDRPLRPLFPKGYLYDTQIITLLLSADGQNDPDILSINGASAALCVSDIPFAGPVGAVRVGRVNGAFVANPTHDQRAESDLDLVYVGDGEKVIMIEGAANELPEADFAAALDFARDAVRVIVDAQRELAAKAAKPKAEPEVIAPHWTVRLAPSESVPGTDAYTEGAKAYQAGQAFEDNPYQDLIDAATDWAGGWQDAAHFAAGTTE
jgi:polyribonucleotide nucleotidyltransferase